MSKGIPENGALAALGAFNCFGGHQRDTLWQVEQPLIDEPNLFGLARRCATATTANGHG